MAHYLPPAIMRFFLPRKELLVKKPILKRKMPPYHGVAQFVQSLKEYDHPITEPTPTPKELRVKRVKRQKEERASRLSLHIGKWDPKEPEKQEVMTGDAYKTLFVARLAYDVSEDDLKYEFEYYGNVVKSVVIQNSKKKKSRGYAFVEFERSKDLKEAYKDADGRKINNKRILVDVERGRTVKNWKPRRLGGGLGGTRIGGKEVNQKFSGRDPPRTPAGGSSSSYRGSSRREPPRSSYGGGGDRRGGGGSSSGSYRGSGGGDRRGGGDRDRDRGGGDRDRRR